MHFTIVYIYIYIIFVSVKLSAYVFFTFPKLYARKASKRYLLKRTRCTNNVQHIKVHVPRNDYMLYEFFKCILFSDISI